MKLSQHLKNLTNPEPKRKSKKYKYHVKNIEVCQLIVKHHSLNRCMNESIENAYNKGFSDGHNQGKKLKN